MSIIQGTARASGDTDFYSFPLSGSLRFDGSGHLTRTPASAGNLQTWTLSFWVQRTRTGTDYIINVRESNAQQNIAEFFLGFRQNLFRVIDANPTRVIVDVTGKIRDFSAWYHYVIVWNTPESAETDRIKIYKNGILQTFTSEETTPQYPDQYDNITHFNSPQKHNIGYSDFYGGSASYEYYLAEFNFIDGQALDQYFFGEFKNGSVWVPYNAFSTAGSGTATASDGDTATDSYGTNGFRLRFSNVSDLGEDSSGKNNDWTVN